MGVWDEIAASIGANTETPFELASCRSLGGGCISQAYHLRGRDGRAFFVKLNDARHQAMFSAEAAGLAAIAATRTLRVPIPLAQGHCGTQAYLVLEYLDIGGRGSDVRLGRELAAMHRNTAQWYGFAHDNFIGATLQPNGWMDEWIAFWRERRLGHQLRLAAHHGYGGRLQPLGERLLEALPAFFKGYNPPPSLLHGDLWGGNHGFLTNGCPVIFDPAAYYGDRECDLAMTELFGGYGSGFYDAYREAWPLAPGFPVRRELYNLYHVLNHANLFGDSYAHQAEEMMGRLLAEAS